MGKYTVFVNENMGEVSWEMVKKQTYMALCYVQVMVVKWTGSFRQMRTAEKLGIPFGVYWTSYAVTGRDAEAEKESLKV